MVCCNMYCKNVACYLHRYDDHAQDGSLSSTCVECFEGASADARKAANVNMPQDDKKDQQGKHDKKEEPGNSDGRTEDKFDHDGESKTKGDGTQQGILNQECKNEGCTIGRDLPCSGCGFQVCEV